MLYSFTHTRIIYIYIVISLRTVRSRWPFSDGAQPFNVDRFSPFTTPQPKIHIHANLSAKCQSVTRWRYAFICVFGLLTPSRIIIIIIIIARMMVYVSPGRTNIIQIPFTLHQLWVEDICIPEKNTYQQTGIFRISGAHTCFSARVLYFRANGIRKMRRCCASSWRVLHTIQANGETRYIWIYGWWCFGSVVIERARRRTDSRVVGIKCGCHVRARWPRMHVTAIYLDARARSVWEVFLLLASKWRPEKYDFFIISSRPVRCVCWCTASHSVWPMRLYHDGQIVCPV